MAKGHARPRGNGKWQLEVDLGSYTDPKTGKVKRHRKFKTITAKNQSEADTKLAKFVVELTSGEYHEPKKINFVDFVNEHWLSKCATKRLSHTTLETQDRKSTRLNSSHVAISYAVFCLKKKTNIKSGTQMANRAHL